MRAKYLEREEDLQDFISDLFKLLGGHAKMVDKITCFTFSVSL